MAAYDGTNLVAVYVNIPRFNPFNDGLYAVINPGVQTKGQPVASTIDRVDHIVDFIRLKRRYMQHRAKYFTVHIRDAVHPNGSGRDEMPAIFWRFDLVNNTTV